MKKKSASGNIFECMDIYHLKCMDIQVDIH